jgi:hypothetical protein
MVNNDIRVVCEFTNFKRMKNYSKHYKLLLESFKILVSSFSDINKPYLDIIDYSKIYNKGLTKITISNRGVNYSKFKLNMFYKESLHMYNHYTPLKGVINSTRFNLGFGWVQRDNYNTNISYNILFIIDNYFTNLNYNFELLSKLITILDNKSNTHSKDKLFSILLKEFNDD